MMSQVFADALCDQETHQQLADKTGLMVVERSADRGGLPVLVAAPSDGKVLKEIPKGMLSLFS